MKFKVTKEELLKHLSHIIPETKLHQMFDRMIVEGEPVEKQCIRGTLGCEIYHSLVPHTVTNQSDLCEPVEEKALCRCICHKKGIVNDCHYLFKNKCERCGFVEDKICRNDHCIQKPQKIEEIDYVNKITMLAEVIIKLNENTRAINKLNGV